MSVLLLQKNCSRKTNLAPNRKGLVKNHQGGLDDETGLEMKSKKTLEEQVGEDNQNGNTIINNDSNIITLCTPTNRKTKTDDEIKNEIKSNSELVTIRNANRSTITGMKTHIILIQTTLKNHENCNNEEASSSTISIKELMENGEELGNDGENAITSTPVIKLPENLEGLIRADHFPFQRHRWNTNEEIASLLISFSRHPEWLSKEVKIRPNSGSMLLYSRKKVRYRRDGYCWKKRKDGKTTREDHMKLKVQGTECIYGCYVHSAILPTFHRRCYWLLQNPDIVLVHYLNVPYPDDNKLIITSPLSMWGDKKEWTKDELVSQLRPMFFSGEEEPDLNNELELSTAETVEQIVLQLMEKQRLARQCVATAAADSSAMLVSSSSGPGSVSASNSSACGSNNSSSPGLQINSNSNTSSSNNGGTTTMVNGLTNGSSGPSGPSSQRLSSSSSSSSLVQISNIPTSTSDQQQQQSQQSHPQQQQQQQQQHRLSMNLNSITQSSSTSTTSNPRIIHHNGPQQQQHQVQQHGPGSERPLLLNLSQFQAGGGLIILNGQPKQQTSGPGNGSGGNSTTNTSNHGASSLATVQNINSNGTTVTTSTLATSLMDIQNANNSGGGTGGESSNPTNSSSISNTTQNTTNHHGGTLFIHQQHHHHQHFKVSYQQQQQQQQQQQNQQHHGQIVHSNSHPNHQQGAGQHNSQQQQQHGNSTSSVVSTTNVTSSSTSGPQTTQVVTQTTTNAHPGQPGHTNSHPNHHPHTHVVGVGEHFFHQETLDMSNEDIQQTLSANMNMVDASVDLVPMSPSEDDVFVNLDAFDILADLNDDLNDHHNTLNGHNSGAGSHAGEKNTIVDINPEWAYSEGGTKILIVGQFQNPHIIYSVHFGDLSVPAVYLQAGVLKCFCPAHNPGLVPIRIYSNGKQISSNSMVFEYKADLRLNLQTISVPQTPTDTTLKLCLIHRMECLEKCFPNLKNNLMGVRSLEDCTVKIVCEMMNFDWPDLVEESNNNNINLNNNNNNNSSSSNTNNSSSIDKIDESSTKNILPPCEKGMNMLHIASALGYTRLIFTLIQWKREKPSKILNMEIDPSARDDFGFIPLMWSAFYGYVECGLILGQWWPQSLGKRDGNGLNSSQIAVSNGFVKFAAELESIQTTNTPAPPGFQNQQLDNEDFMTNLARFQRSSSTISEDFGLKDCFFGQPDTCLGELSLPSEEESRVLTLAEQIIAAIPDRIKESCEDMSSESQDSSSIMSSDPSEQNDYSFEYNERNYRYYDSGTPCSSLSPSSSCLQSPCSFSVDYTHTTADFSEFLQASAFEKDFSNLTLSDKEQRELYEAAKVIQKAYRNWKIEKSKVVLQQNVERSLHCFYERKRVEDEEKEKQAAVIIQNYYRRYKQYLIQKRQVTSAALVIQNQYRNYCENKRFKKSLDHHTHSHSHSHSQTSLRTYSQRRQNQAAKKIQQFMRQSKNKLQKERAEKEKQLYH